MTLRQIEKEISDQLYLSGHRVNLMDLVSVLDLDIIKIQAAAARLIQKSEGIRMINTDLISNRYLEMIVEEVQETISESGFMSLTDISRRFDLSLDLVRQIMSNAMGGVIQGKLQGGIVYTKAFIERHGAVVRGALTGVSKPLDLDTVITRFSLERNLFMASVESLIAARRIAGSLKGTLFTPDVYSFSQRDAVLGFYRMNGYIEYATLTKHKFANPKEYLAESYPDGRALPTVFVSQGLVDQAEGSIEEAVASSAWIDVAHILPTPFTAQDTLAVIEACVASRSVPCTVADGGYVVSTAFLEAAGKSVEDQVAKEVAEAIAARAKAAKAQEATPTAERAEGGDESDDSDGGGRGKAQKGKKSDKDAGKKKAKGAAAQQAPAAASKKAGATSILDGPLGTARLAEIVSSLGLVRDDGRGDPASFVPVLARLVSKRASAALENARAKEVSAAGVSKAELKQLHARQAEKIIALYENTTLLVRGAESLPDARDQLERHALKTIGSEAAVAIIEWSVLGHVDLSTLKLSSGPQERKSFVKGLAADVQKALLPVLEAQDGPSGEAFLTALEDAGEFFGCVLKRIDKKKEKILLTSHRGEVSRELGSCQGSAAAGRAFQLAVVLLHLRLRKVLLSIPKKLTLTVASSLDSHLSAEEATWFKSFRSKVVESLQKDEGSTAADITDAEVEALVKFAETAGHEPK